MEKENKFIKSIQDEMEKEAKELKANESIRSNALEALRKKQESKKTPVIPLVFNYKVPLWMVAASVILIVLLLPYTFKANVNGTINSPQLAVHDTVYVDRIVTDTIEIAQPSDTVVKTVYVKENKSLNETSAQSPSKHDLEVLNMKKLEAIIALNNVPSKIDFAIQASGKSLSEDELGKSILNISK